MVRALGPGLKNQINTPPVISPPAIDIMVYLPEVKLDWEAVIRYCDSMYLG